jgi:arylsulfatase A-like enzyme
LVLARLQHPNIVMVFDVGVDETDRFIVMELVEGSTLREALNAEGRLEPHRAASIADGIAEQGIKYNRFHVTALCSPTRAALLTGRNNHFVGFGSVGEFAGGFPGVLGDPAAGLRAVPEDPSRQRLLHGCVRETAPDPRWPTGPGRTVRPVPNGWGFDYFYGILGGGSSQWDPCLAENQKIHPGHHGGGHHRSRYPRRIEGGATGLDRWRRLGNRAAS